MSQHKREQLPPSLVAQIPSNSLLKKQYLQKAIKEKDLNRILYDQDNTATPEERIKHIQDSVTQLPQNLLRNHLHMPINIIQSQQQKSTTPSGLPKPKPKPILTENMQQQLNKIRTALTPLNSNIKLTTMSNKLNQSFDVQHYDNNTTNLTTEDRRKRSVKDIQIHSYYGKPPTSSIGNESSQQRKARHGSLSQNANKFNEQQFKNSYDISQQPSGKSNKLAVAQQTFKNVYLHNMSYTTRASTARSNTQRLNYQTNTDTTRILRNRKPALKQQSLDVRNAHSRQNSFSINNSVEYFSVNNEKQTLDNINQGNNGFSQPMTPYSIEMPTNSCRPFTSQTQVVQSSMTHRPSTHLKFRRNTCLESSLDQQIDVRDSSRMSITPVAGQVFEMLGKCNNGEYQDAINDQEELTSESGEQQKAPIQAERNLERRNGVINMKKVNKNVDYINQYTSQFLPPWIRKRPDFIRVYLQTQISKKLTIPKICLKSINERYISDLSTIEEYLRKIKQLQDLSQEFMKSICQNLKVQIYWEGEKVINIGDDMSHMFTIFEGELIEQLNGNKLRVLKEGELYFRNALIKETKSEYDYFANQQCIVLYLERKDYQEIIIKQQERVINNLRIDIRFQTLFKDFPKETLTKLCDALEGRLYLKDETVYEFQDPPQNFYLIYEGEIRCETVFYMLNQNCWPKKNFEKVVDHDYHEYRTFSKTLKNEKILGKGSFFGDQEVIYDLGRMASTVAHTNCFLLSITKKEFFQIFTYKEINMFIQYRQNAPIKLEKNLKSIEKDQKNKDARKRIMSALNILYESAPSKDKVEKIEQKIKAFKQYIENKDFNEPEEN